MKKKGFTLIELLVVIAIIGLLATISVVALNAARAGARDGVRVADIKQIRTALDLFYNEAGHYPIDASVTTSIYTTSTIYMQVFPTAPTPPDGDCTVDNNAYDYTQTGTGGSSYTITYCLGGDSGALNAGPATATPQSMQ